MAQWIETRLRYDKIDERGRQKKVNEPYLVDALSFTEAEARITEEMKPYISGEFSVAAVKKAKIADVFSSVSCGNWYKVRAAIFTVDKKSGCEKRSISDFLVQALTIEDALTGFRSEISPMVDYEITAITETPIIDVFPVKYSNSK